MQLISLNLWGGMLLDPLIRFVKDSAQYADIYCFQEVFKSEPELVNKVENRFNLFSILEKILPEFKGHFSPAQDGFDYQGLVDIRISFGLAIFIRKSFSVASVDAFFIFGDRNSMKGHDDSTLPCNAQCITFNDQNNIRISICNTHGISEWPKIDTDERLRQSTIIREFLDNQSNAKILCGDLNLLPETKSIQLLEKNMRNLVTEFKIKDTRGKVHELDPHVSDYMFVSNDINVRNFSVSDMSVSDHLPLILDFSLG